MLILLGLIAALFIRDDAVSLGQTAPQNVQISAHGAADNVPEYLRELVDTLVWIRRRDG
jgi:hypothetical protein